MPLSLLSKEVFKKFSSNQTNLRANLIKLGVLIALIGSPVSSPGKYQEQGNETEDPSKREFG